MNILNVVTDSGKLEGRTDELGANTCELEAHSDKLGANTDDVVTHCGELVEPHTRPLPKRGEELA
ncbi:hypothetical protein [Prolixibacter sp. SD074]|uniref:hypothetical protein n=1 Tax=Prolixibacter sp. SD074 TaxID=2652391 RepID=UPI001273799F|nr:hypothetical protein [Prolixibacter sp. SD074]GET30777.1 hypothetical protein SD074_29790 [Prolixibacter sp. SD074]